MAGPPTPGALMDDPAACEAQILECRRIDLLNQDLNGRRFPGWPHGVFSEISDQGTDCLVDRMARCPREALANERTATAVFYLAQHAPADVARSVEDLLEEAHSAGWLNEYDWARFVDRRLINDGELQRYGTQARKRDGHTRICPVADPEGLVARREGLGLPTLEAQMQRLEGEVAFLDVCAPFVDRAGVDWGRVGAGLAELVASSQQLPDCDAVDDHCDHPVVVPLQGLIFRRMGWSTRFGARTHEGALESITLCWTASPHLGSLRAGEGRALVGGVCGEGVGVELWAGPAR